MKYISKSSLYILILLIGVYFIFYRSSGSKPKSAQFSREYQHATQQGDCPPEGSAVRNDIRTLNILKNRTTLPRASDFDPLVQLKDIFREGDDRHRFDEQKAIRVRAYVSEVKPGGMETCNCKAKNIDARDTHIELRMNPMDGGTLPVIAEITPALRKIKLAEGIDWSTKRIRDLYLGRWVEIEGWMMFDREHASQAEHTAPGRPRNWRVTAWEIHPVTSIKISQRPAR